MLDQEYIAKEKHLLDLIKVALYYAEDNDLEAVFLYRALQHQQRTLNMLKGLEETA